MSTTDRIHRSPRRLAALVAAGALLATACGGDGNDGESANRERAGTTADAVTTDQTPTAPDATTSVDTSGSATTVVVTTDTTPPAPATTAAPTTAAPATAALATTVPVATTAAPATDTTAAVVTSEATEAELIDLFEDYRTALLTGDGPTGASYLSANTVAWYDELADHARTADEDAVLNTLTISDALSVLAFRSSVDRVLLLGADGRSLLIEGIRQGLIGDNVATLNLSAVTIDGNEAVGIVNGQPGLFYVLDDDGWKLDLQAVTAQLDAAPENLVIRELSGGTADTREELFELVALGLGTTLDELTTPLT